MENDENNKQPVNETTPPVRESQESTVDEVVVTAKKQHPLRDAAIRVITAPLMDGLDGAISALKVPGDALGAVTSLAKGDFKGAAGHVIDAGEHVFDAKLSVLQAANPVANMGGQAVFEGVMLKINADEKAAFKAAHPEMYGQPTQAPKAPEVLTPIDDPITAQVVAERPAAITLDPALQTKLAELQLTKFEVADASPAQPVAPSSSKGAEIKLAQNATVGGGR